MGNDSQRYTLNSPTNYTDPTGHSVDCGIGDPYCQAGKLNVQRRADDLYRTLSRQGVRQERLSESQRLVFEEAGVPTDDLGRGLRDVSGMLEDPVVWVTGAFAGAKLLPLMAQQAVQLAARCVTNSALCARILTGSAGASQVARPLADEQRQVAVLGRNPQYIQVAGDVKGQVFSIPVDQWNALTPDEQWAANQAFLDQAIKNGTNFYLASPWSSAAQGSWYYRELQYLFSQGYTWAPGRSWLIPPGP